MLSIKILHKVQFHSIHASLSNLHEFCYLTSSCPLSCENDEECQHKASAKRSSIFLLVQFWLKCFHIFPNHCPLPDFPCDQLLCWWLRLHRLLADGDQTTQIGRCLLLDAEDLCTNHLHHLHPKQQQQK